jgi:hypothetical protein
MLPEIRRALHMDPPIPEATQPRDPSVVVSSPPTDQEDPLAVRADETLPQEAKEVVQDYLSSYRDLLMQETSVEIFYTKALAVEAALLQRADGQGTVLEALSPKTFEDLRRQLSAFGIVIIRGESLFADIDSLFFVSIASRSGTEADAQFFGLYRETYPRDSLRPAYEQAQTHETSCTKFEAHNLTDLYNGWTLFRSHFPANYTERAAEIIELIEYELTESTCACGDRESVMTELRSFLEKFPTSRIAKTLEERLRGIEDRHTPIRFHCVSG